MDLSINSGDADRLLKFFRREEVITVSIEDDPEVYVFYGPRWVPVFCYVLKLLSISEEEKDDHGAVLKNTINLFIVSVPNSDPNEEEKQHVVKVFWKDFVPLLQKYFKVPIKMPSVLHLDQNEILAAFLDFLLQIWNTKAMPDFQWKKQRYSLLHKELKFLLTFLGDVPFQRCTTHHGLLNTLLAEFEILANQAGHFTFFFILSPREERFTEFDEAIDTLVHKVECLNTNIKQYCIAFSKSTLMSVNITNLRVKRPIDSLFIVDSLLEDLETLINRRFHVIINVDMEDQISELYQELKRSRILLKDIKLLSQERENDGFITIREVTYEVEYLINSYVVGNIPNWYLKLRLPAVTQKLKLSLSRLLQGINSNDDLLPVTQNVTLQPRETAIVVKEHLVGFQKSKIEILDKLIGGSKALQIISLVGMPGLGKTTIAKNLFDSSSVQTHFDRHAWCVISQNYEKKRVLIETLMSLSKDENKVSLMAMNDETLLGLKIHKSLYKRRYIIIIDDIWSSSTWNEIRRYFPDDSNGSRIMFTSRNKDAVPKKSISYTLPLLSKDECLDLLLQKVFVNKSCPPCLLDIGERIIKGCHGLPLAVVAVAGILANMEKEESVWKKMEKDLGTFILDDHQGCMKVLDYSYEHLPDHLKLSYLYLGTFSEDAEIPVGKLKKLWIAEGFIQKEEKKTPEDIADKYLDDLINRSLVLIAKRKFGGGVKSCGIHDLLRDLCLRKADEENFMNCTKQSFPLYGKHHRVRVDHEASLLLSHFSLHYRSFSGYLSMGSSCFPQMPLHRVINMSRDRSLHVTELEGIDMLVHLRYLCVSKQKLSLQSTSNLVNLEVLDVNIYCGTKIASSIILKMTKLKHLKIRGLHGTHGARIINDSDGCPITNLQSLSGIRVSKPGDEKFLKCCPNLRKLDVRVTDEPVLPLPPQVQSLMKPSKRHYYSDYVVGGIMMQDGHPIEFVDGRPMEFESRKPCDPRFPDIDSLTNLETLVMHFGYNAGEQIDLATVKFPLAIKKLTLMYTTCLPWDAMSIIGRLPNLEILNLVSNTFMGEEWETRDDEFQKLRFLKLNVILGLKQWITCSEHFPELQCLMLERCDKLQNIPSDMGNIPTLQTIEVKGCGYELCESVVRIKAEQCEMGNEELQVKIINSYFSQERLLQRYKELKKAFSLLDEGCNITTSEFAAAIRSLAGGYCPTEAELERMITEVDGIVNFPEFVDLIAKIRVPYSENLLQNTFQLFNFGGGSIGASDLIHGLRNHGQIVTIEEAKKMVREADIDGDGKINYREFKKLMMTIDIPRPNELRNVFLMVFTNLDKDEDDDDDYDDERTTLTTHVPITHFSHPHPLQPILTDQNMQITYCSGCNHKSSATMYTCQPCDFRLHHLCSKLPELITLPCHVGCTLSFRTEPPYLNRVFKCNRCYLFGDGWSYHCYRCKYGLHVSCASKQLKIKHNTSKLKDAIH